MSSSSLVTPSSGKSIYFDAPITHFNTAVSGDKQMSVSENKSLGEGASRTRSPTNPAVGSTTDTAEKDEDLDALAEKDAPAYTPPGPNEKLSRSYLSADSKSPVQYHPKISTKRKPESTDYTTDPQSSGLTPPKRTTSVTSRNKCPSPASISGTSGHVKEEGPTFENGAAITGPKAQPKVDDSVHFRAATAETSLSVKTKSKLSKAELKDGKRLSKIIKAESKAEKKALAACIKELSELQSQQISAVKREEKAYSAHTKALKLHHQTESKYLKLKAEYEQNQLNAQNMEAALERERANCREMMERTAEKAREVEKLRIMYGTDERERYAKLLELNQGKPESRFALSNIL